MNRNSSKNSPVLICLMLAFVTFAVYYQVHSFDFVNYDDPIYVYENPHIQSGLTFDAVRQAFTSSYANFWHPLTMISYMLDWQLFGNNAGGYHLTNLFFHIVNTLLLFLVLKQMTSAIWQSAFVAALFALHPLHVESVAWVSQRKDVLSTFFWFLAIWAYLQYVRKPNIFRYLLILLTFALGLMAKPMLITLPFVLLLLDYWPLNRINSFQWRIICRLVLEKIPFIVLSAVLSVVAFIAQQSGGAVTQLANLGLKFRIFNALISYVKYMGKMFCPNRLTMFYPHPGENVSLLYAVISAAILMAITVLVIRLTRKHRYLLVGWFWYIGTLLPVTGLIQVGSHAMADRYTYITLTGLFIIIAWGASDLLAKLPHRKIMLWISSLVVLSILSILSYLQTRYWKDSMSLFQHALAVTRGNYVAHYNVADVFLEQDQIEQAIRHYSQALRINPQYADAMNNLGITLQKTGKIDEAIGYYRRALDIDPNNVKIYSNYGMALVAIGEFDEAISLYNKALQVAPDSINIRLNLGVALTGSGKLERAVREYEKILLIQPQNATAHNDFGVVLYQQGKLDDAILYFNRALQIAPDYTDAKNNLNVVLAEKQKVQNKDAENTKK